MLAFCSWGQWIDQDSIPFSKRTGFKSRSSLIEANGPRSMRSFLPQEAESTAPLLSLKNSDTYEEIMKVIRDDRTPGATAFTVRTRGLA